MLLLAATTDKLQLTTAVATAIDVHVSYVDASNTTLVPSGAGKQNTAITTATTTDILAAPGASTVRNAKTINIRNKDSTLANTVTVIFDQNGTDFVMHSVTLLAGETLQYIEGVGWFTVESKVLNRILRVSGADYVNATTSFTDITGLTCPVQSGKAYSFFAHLDNLNNASTTGSRFSINGPSLSGIRMTEINVVTASATAAAMSAGAAAAVNTAVIAQTTGSATSRMSILSGGFVAGADGTFAVRGASEVAVAAGLTVRQGSFCHIFEATG